jgi:hypothetical protein
MSLSNTVREPRKDRVESVSRTRGVQPDRFSRSFGEHAADPLWTPGTNG